MGATTPPSPGTGPANAPASQSARTTHGGEEQDTTPTVQGTSIEERLERMIEEKLRPLLNQRLRESQDEANIPSIERALPILSEATPDPVVATPRAGSKRRTEDDLPSRPVKRNLKPEKLPEYRGKTVREHLEFFRRAEIAFRLTPEEFEDDLRKVLFVMQYLQGEPQDAWYRHYETADLNLLTWEQFKEFMLDLVEDPVNRQLHIAQRYEDAAQQPRQSAQSFAAYLSSLEAQLNPFTEEQQVFAFFCKLRPELRKQVAMYQDLPKTRESMVALATRVENSMKGTSTTPARNQATDSPTNSQKEQGNRNPGASSKPPQTTPKDLSGITCYNCGEKGHYANSCPKSQNPNMMSIASVTTSGNDWPPAEPLHRRGAQ
jgi:hypothetical protein